MSQIPTSKSKRANFSYQDADYPDRSGGGPGHSSPVDVPDHSYPVHDDLVSDVDQTSVDFADAGEYSEQGSDPDRYPGGPGLLPAPKPHIDTTEANRMSRQKQVMKLSADLDKLLGTEKTKQSPETSALAKSDLVTTRKNLNVNTGERYLKQADMDQLRELSFEIHDVREQINAAHAAGKSSEAKSLQKELEQLLAQHEQIAAKTAVYEDDWYPSEGDLVRYTPSGREGKVTEITDRYAVVDFGSEEAPETRHVSVNHLRPVNPPHPEDQDENPSPNSSGGNQQITVQPTKGTPLVTILLQTAKKAALSKQFENWLGRQPVQEVLDILNRERAGEMRDLREVFQHHGMSLDHEVMRRGVVAAVIDNPLMDCESFLDTLKVKLAPRFAMTLPKEGHDGGAGRSNPTRDPSYLPERVVRDTIRSLEEDEEQGHLSAEEEAEYGSLLEEEKRRLTNVEQGNNIVKTYSQLGDAFEQELTAERNAQLDYLIRKHAVELKNSLTFGSMEGLGEEDLVEVFAGVMGLISIPEGLYRRVANQVHDIHPGTRVGWEKTAASTDLPEDLFNDDEFNQSERHLGSLAVSNLEEERPRLLASPSKLISKAATQFRKDMRKLRSGYTIEEVNLNEINADKVGEDGRMITGNLVFHVRLAAHLYNRRSAVDVVMDVLDGEPQSVCRFRTSTGRELPFDSVNLDKVMSVRRDNLRRSNRVTKVPRAFINEG